MFTALWYWVCGQRRSTLRWGLAAGVALASLTVLLLSATGEDGPTPVGERIYNVEIKRVLGGHTVKLKSDERMIYAGIRAPYSNEPFHEEARRRNAELVEGKEVRLRYDDRQYDRKKRLWAYVFVDGDFINATLVREGMAYVRLTPDSFRYAEELLAAQKEARKNKRGLWRELPRAVEPRYPADPKYGNFHRPDCGEVTKIKPERLTEFKTKDAAYRTGCAPCSTCQP